MIENYFHLAKIALDTLAILLVLTFFFRKHIISVFDPLFYFLVTQAFSIKLALMQIEYNAYLINFLLCQFFFVVGFLLVAGKPIENTENTVAVLFKPKIDNVSVLKVFAWISFIFVLVGNIYLVSQKGIALLADDPSAAKGENFIQGDGLGLVRRINWGLLYLLALVLIYLFLYKRSLKYLWLCLILLLIVSISGSKGVFIYFITLIPLIGQFKDVKKSPQFMAVNASKYLLISTGFVLALFIVGADGEGAFGEAGLRLGSRMLFFGDAMLYYYDPLSVKHFSNLNFFDLVKEDFNSVAGLLRLVPYKRPIGFDMVEYQVGISLDTVFGPNVPYYVKGHIFFGALGAIVYSCFVGAVVGYVRRLYYNLLNTQHSILHMLLVIHLNLIIVSYPQDSNYFITVVFDTIILSAPFYLIGYLILKSSTLQPHQVADTTAHSPRLPLG